MEGRRPVSPPGDHTAVCVGEAAAGGRGKRRGGTASRLVPATGSGGWSEGRQGAGEPLVSPPERGRRQPAGGAGMGRGACYRESPATRDMPAPILERTRAVQRGTGMAFATAGE